jgi:hypothetical protein
VGKLIFGDGSKESMIEIPQGQLYLVRPRSMKGYSELIFKDGAARIRKTNQEFQYQLVIQRAYEEGEEELLDEEDAESAALAGERDEKTFLLDEQLHFRSEIREGGEKVLAWRDLSGDAGDLYEFVCDISVEEAQVQAFELTAIHCQYERKHRKNHLTATTKELAEFTFVDEPPIPTASPVQSPSYSPEALSPVHTMPLNTRSTANSALSSDHLHQSRTAPRQHRQSPYIPNHDRSSEKNLENYISSIFSLVLLLSRMPPLRPQSQRSEIGVIGYKLQVKIGIGLDKRSLQISIRSLASNICLVYSTLTLRMVMPTPGFYDLKMRLLLHVSKKHLCKHYGNN